MAAKKQKTIPSLAKMAAEQVITAHREVATEVLDALWANRAIREVIEERVMAKKRTNTAQRHYELRETDYVAVIGIDEDDPPLFVENALFPASKLPKWLFVLLFHWVRDVLHRERPYPVPGGCGWETQPRARCGFGGLWLPLFTRDELLGVYDLLIGRTVDMLPKLFEAFAIDPSEQFGQPLSQWGANQEAKDFMRNHLATHAFACHLYEGRQYVGLAEWVQALDIEMASINRSKWFLPAPVVTLTFRYNAWGRKS
jgi:hypothetical protein